MSHRVGENPAAMRAAIFSLSSKNFRGVAPPPPPLARVKKGEWQQIDEIFKIYVSNYFGKNSVSKGAVKVLSHFNYSMSSIEHVICSDVM